MINESVHARLAACTLCIVELGCLYKSCAKEIGSKLGASIIYRQTYNRKGRSTSPVATTSAGPVVGVGQDT